MFSVIATHEITQKTWVVESDIETREEARTLARELSGREMDEYVSYHNESHS